jgi:urea transport system ATP-binding protein
MATTSPTTEAPKPHSEAPNAILRVEDVTIEFDGFKAVQELSFSISAGEVRFLIGPNGAGKTTILDAICGRVKPSKGHIFFKDRFDLTRFQEHQIARMGVGRKFQAPSVFISLSTRDNLELARAGPRNVWSALRAKSSDSSRVEEVLEMIGLTQSADIIAGELSHGQKQWLEIGMLLMQEPDVLLLDEPAAGMTDLETEHMGELLHRIAATHSILVVEHDMEFVRRFAHRVTVMHEGKVLCEGTMDEVQNNEQVAEVYLGRRVAAE